VVLVDTSVWGDHLRIGNVDLSNLLVAGEVLTHPAVIGELASSNLRDRAETLALFRRLPSARLATDDEVMALVENLSLHGRGIGWIDAHLLASARLTGCALWTNDRPLRAAALHTRLHIH
jgi:hypothetical protein